MDMHLETTSNQSASSPCLILAGPDQGELERVKRRGAGITPIMLASTVDFWQAEAALLGGDAPGARTAMLAGLAKSVAKVQGFASLDPTADDSFAPDAAAVTAHADAVGAAFDAAVTAGDVDGWWNVMAQEFFVSLFGNGSDAYNFYRRTGYPNNLQPNLETPNFFACSSAKFTHSVIFEIGTHTSVE